MVARRESSGRRLVGRCLVALCVFVGWAVCVPGAGAVAPAYVTPMIAHTAWTATENCVAVPGVVTLPGLLSGHKSRGMSLTGSVVTSWVAATTRKCIEPLPLMPHPKPILMPSWADLANLRGTYPAFDLVSASRPIGPFRLRRIYHADRGFIDRCMWVSSGSSYLPDGALVSAGWFARACAPRGAWCGSRVCGAPAEGDGPGLGVGGGGGAGDLGGSFG
jgi:hypothetical protein